MKRFALALPLIFVLAACAPSQVTTEQLTPSGSTPMDDPALLPTLAPNAEGSSELSRLDEQGAVVFEVTPLNLSTLARSSGFSPLCWR